MLDSGSLIVDAAATCCNCALCRTVSAVSGIVGNAVPAGASGNAGVGACGNGGGGDPPKNNGGCSVCWFPNGDSWEGEASLPAFAVTGGPLGWGSLRSANAMLPKSAVVASISVLTGLTSQSQFGQLKRPAASLQYPLALGCAPSWTTAYPTDGGWFRLLYSSE